MKTLNNFKYMTIKYVDDSEMKEILKDKELVLNLKSGLKDVKNKNYKIII